MAAAMMNMLAGITRWSNTLEGGRGSKRKAKPRLPMAIDALKSGVKKPMRTKMPLVANSMKAIHTRTVHLLSSERDSATSVVVVSPTAARSKSRPRAGKPVGKLTNGLFSAHLRER